MEKKKIIYFDLNEDQFKDMLKNTNDYTLSQMLNQRKNCENADIDVKEAIKNEIARRCAREYILRHGEELGINESDTNTQLTMIDIILG
jgi:hypothetical protein